MKRSDFKKIIFSILLLTLLVGGFFVFRPNVQSPELNIKASYQNEDYYVFWIDPDRHQVDFYWKDDQGGILGNFEKLKSHVESRDQELIFAMNGGIFDPGGIPKGLHVQGGEKIQEIDLRGGEGNFYLQPNGVFLLSDQGFQVVETSKYQENDSIEFALQSGPLLLGSGVIHPEFDPESQSKYVRNGVGITEEGEMVFVLSKRVVTLYEFASYFKEELGVSDALYFDGFVSRLYWPEVGVSYLGGEFGVMVGVVDQER